ncbi:flagellin [Alishewanella longhuensis]
MDSAADDAAGLQISNRLTSQINGLDQASTKMTGISLAQVAEGAMDEITTSLQRMRTLVVQSENGINSSQDRTAIQKEITALQTEITRIAQTTKFGDQNLLNADTNDFAFLVGAKGTDNEYINVDLGNTGVNGNGWGSSALGVNVVNVELGGLTGASI